MSRQRLIDIDSEVFRTILRYDHPQYGEQEYVFGPYTTPGPAKSMATSHARTLRNQNIPYSVETQVVPADAWRTIDHKQY